MPPEQIDLLRYGDAVFRAPRSADAYSLVLANHEEVISPTKPQLDVLVRWELRCAPASTTGQAWFC